MGGILNKAFGFPWATMLPIVLQSVLMILVVITTYITCGQYPTNVNSKSDKIPIMDSNDEGNEELDCIKLEEKSLINYNSINSEKE